MGVFSSLPVNLKCAFTTWINSRCSSDLTLPFSHFMKFIFLTSCWTFLKLAFFSINQFIYLPTESFDILNKSRTGLFRLIKSFLRRQSNQLHKIFFILDFFHFLRNLLHSLCNLLHIQNPVPAILVNSGVNSWFCMILHESDLILLVFEFFNLNLHIKNMLTYKIIMILTTMSTNNSLFLALQDGAIFFPM